jgi:hypothetical protein
MPAGLLLIIPLPTPAAWILSRTEPVGKLELLPPPPQPLSKIIRPANPNIANFGKLVCL